MTKPRHEWAELTSFKTYGCLKCTCIKKWDVSFGRYVYAIGTRSNLFKAPPCISFMNCDKKVVTLL